MSASQSRDAETRRYPRLAGELDAWCVGMQRVAVRVKNLNLGGCLVRGALLLVSGGFAVGETFKLEIALGAEGTVTVDAATLYHTVDGSAVTFKNLRDDVIEHIRKTVEDLDPLMQR